MRRYFQSFFVCAFVLAACSPRYYHGEQVARTLSQAETYDSTYLRRYIDRLVQEELQKRLDIQEWSQLVSVTELLSDPDSAGVQHVTERTTTTASHHSQTSAGSSWAKSEGTVAQLDSGKTQSSSSAILHEEKEEKTGEVKGWMPWYMYIVGLICAVVVGIVIALYGKKWWKIKL